MIGTTITQFLIEEQRGIPEATGDLTAVINDVVTACKAISAAMRYGALSDEDVLGASASTNTQGETQKNLDIIANEVFLRRTEFGGHVAAMVSEEMDSIHQLPPDVPAGRYLLVYDPVDGSSNVAENAAIGTIFSILKRPHDASGKPAVAEFLQPGDRQVCAGYAIYGPSTMIVVTTGNGVNGFTLDPLIGEFVLTHPAIRIPESSERFTANLVHARHYDETIRGYFWRCIEGSDGEHGRDVDLRWSAGAVADVHRLLISGGIYINPGSAKLREYGWAGKLRLLYEVNPLAFIVEQAGGIASNGESRVLEQMPEDLHQRSPVILGSKIEVREYLDYVSACSGESHAGP